MSGKKVYWGVLSVRTEKKPGPHGGETTVPAEGTQGTERMSQCTFGSVTVEAAIAFPFFWYAILGFMYFLLFFLRN